MTINCPQKKARFRYFVGTLFAILLMGGVSYIVEYRSLVEKKHEIDALKKTRVALNAENADLKNAYYAVIDPSRLEAAAKDSGLTLEKRPKYLTRN